MKKIISGLFLSGMVVAVFAEVPVVDYSSSAAAVSSTNTAQSFAMPTVNSPRVVVPPPPPPAVTNFSIDQRVNRLEQQVNNINGQNLVIKIEELQQSLQKANGKLEDQEHKIEQLNKQLKDFYQDVRQRLGIAIPTQPAVPQSGLNTPTPAMPAFAANATSGSGLIPATTSNVAGVFESPQPSAPSVKAESAFLKEQQMYQTAIDLLPDKKHESENKLRDYLKQYPKGVYVPNAHYWLGEINFLQKNFDAAEEEFKIVINKYPKSKRIADAKLKLALVHQNQGRDAEAKKELQEVAKLYPGTSAAQLAKQQLGTK